MPERDVARDERFSVSPQNPPEKPAQPQAQEVYGVPKWQIANRRGRMGFRSTVR